MAESEDDEDYTKRFFLPARDFPIILIRIPPRLKLCPMSSYMHDLNWAWMLCMIARLFVN